MAENYETVKNFNKETGKYEATPYIDKTGDSNYIPVENIDKLTGKKLAVPVIKVAETAYSTVDNYDKVANKYLATPVIYVDTTTIGGGDTITNVGYDNSTKLITITTDEATWTINLSTLSQDLQTQIDSIVNGGYLKDYTYDSVTGTLRLIKNDGTFTDIPLGGTTIELDPIYLADKPNIALNSTEVLLTGVVTLHNGDGSTIKLLNEAKIRELIDDIITSGLTITNNGNGTFTFSNGFILDVKADSTSYYDEATSTIHLVYGTSEVVINLSAITEKIEDLSLALAFELGLIYIITDDLNSRIIDLETFETNQNIINTNLQNQISNLLLALELITAIQELQFTFVNNKIEDLQTQIDNIVSTGGGSVVSIDTSTSGQFTLTINGVDTLVKYEFDTITYDSINQRIVFKFKSGNEYYFDVSGVITNYQNILARLTANETNITNNTDDILQLQNILTSIGQIAGVNLIGLIIIGALLNARVTTNENNITDLDNRVTTLESLSIPEKPTYTNNGDGTFTISDSTGTLLTFDSKADSITIDYTNKQVVISQGTDIKYIDISTILNAIQSNETDIGNLQTLVSNLAAQNEEFATEILTLQEVLILTSLIALNAEYTALQNQEHIGNQGTLLFNLNNDVDTLNTKVATINTQLPTKMNVTFGNANVGSATAGQVLTVNSGANGVEFTDTTKYILSVDDATALADSSLDPNNIYYTVEGS